MLLVLLQNQSVMKLNYVVNKLTKDPKNGGNSIIKLSVPLAASVISGGVSSLVSAGINLLFGSFIGRKSTETNTVQKLEFKTQGTLSLVGTITGTDATNVSPVANLLIPGTDLTMVNNTIYPNFNKKLGVWNLKNTPKVIANKKAFHYFNDGFGEIYNRYISIEQSSIDVVLNPDILSEISNYTVETDLYYYHRFNNMFDWNGSSSSQMILSYQNKSLAYDDGKNVIYKDISSEYLYGPTPEPQNDMNTDYEPSHMIYNHLPNNYVVKVTVTLYPKVGYNTTPIVITRSYIPNYQLVD